MASASAIKAGEAFVRIFLDKEDIERDLKKVQSSLNKFARTAREVGIALTAIGGSALFGLSRAVKAANEVELTARRLDAVFQDNAASAREFARTLASEIGASRFEIEKALTTFQAFATGVGFTGEQSIKLAQDLTTLSRDFGAFQGIDSGESLQRFISALSGSPEVLDRFGINLKAAAIDARFAANGLDETTESASEFQKVLARFDIIKETLQEQGAIGKARQELNKFNGRLVQAKAAVLDFLVAVGRPLLTVLKPVLIAFTTLVKAVTILADTFPILSVVVGAAAVSITALGAGLITLSLAAGAATISIGLLGAASKRLGVSLFTPIASFKAIVQVSKILNESVLVTAANMALGANRVKAIGSVASKLVPIFSRVGSAIRAVLSPVALVAVGVGIVIALLVSLTRRLFQIFGSIKPLIDPIVSLFKSLASGAVKLFTVQIDGVKLLIRTLPGLSNAIKSVAGFFRGYFDLAKEGLAELKDNFKAVTDFLGLTKKGSIEIAAEQSGGPTLTPEEQAAEEERLAKRRIDLANRVEDLRIAGIRNTTQRAIAEIETRYAREIALAKEAGDETAQIEAAKAQELTNLRTQLVEQFYRRQRSLDDQISRERAAGIKDEFARRVREAEISRDAALRAENITLQERRKINELFNTRIENIEKDRVRAIAEFEQDIGSEILRAQLDGTQTRLEADLAAIAVKYAAERAEAQKLNADLEKVDAARRAREDRAIRKEEERRRQAIEELEQRRADATEDTQRQIDRIDIDLGQGTEFEKALQKLELERVEAISDSDANLDVVNELFDKREQLLRQNEAARKLEGQQGRAFGTFDALQVGALGQVGSRGKTKEQELLERQVHEAERQTRIQEEIRDGQGAK